MRDRHREREGGSERESEREKKGDRLIDGERKRKKKRSVGCIYLSAFRYFKNHQYSASIIFTLHKLLFT